MPIQAPLFEFTADDLGRIVVLDDDPRTGTLSDRAERWHIANPQVYRLIVRIARALKAKGFIHYGIGAIWEYLRFKGLETTGDVYKLNNNYRAWYARKIMAQEPDLAGFFLTRDCPHDEAYRDRPVRRRSSHRRSQRADSQP